MNDQAIEQEIQAKGLTAPRVTPADIEENIASEHYFTGLQGSQAGRNAEAFATYSDLPANVPHKDALGLLTFCVLTLRNGFTVTGESACASPENFDAELGRKIARENAVNKIWPLMGYALKERLHREARGDENQFADEQNRMRLEMTVALVKLMGLPNSATCEDVLNAVREFVRPSPHLSFGQALLALKRGQKVCRSGWNGKGMWLSLSGPLEGRKIGNESFWSQNNARYAAEQPDCSATVLPCITMKTATGEILMGWLASQTDMLAEDWMIVE